MDYRGIKTFTYPRDEAAAGQGGGGGGDSALLIDILTVSGPSFITKMRLLKENVCHMINGMTAENIGWFQEASSLFESCKDKDLGTLSRLSGWCFPLQWDPVYEATGNKHSERAMDRD